MSISISEIDPTITIDKLQFSPENQYFERKNTHISDKKVAHQISAMANASGGIIVIGIEDDGEITGIDDKRENELRQIPINFLKTIPQHKVEIIVVSGQLKIFLFHILPMPDEVIKTKDDEAYLRIGDTSRKLNSEQLLELEYSKGIRSFESRVIDEASLEDLDDELIGEYCKILNLQASSPLDILKSRGLIRQKEDNWSITVAAILLFGKIPTQFLPSARVRFLRYEGTTAGVGTEFNVVKDFTIEKPLHKSIAECKQLIASQMREFQQLGKDGKFRKIPEYPEFAWLEGLVNAVTHRDYSISGEYIRVTMFDDRIEFLSPGRLPSIVTVENIQTTRFSRNPLIARVLSDFGWVRELNEGVKRIYTDMKLYFLDPPVFSEPNRRTVQLELKNNIASRSLRKMEGLKSITVQEWAKLKPLDRDIIYYIANIEHCTPRRLEESVGRSRQAVLQHVKKLLKENGGPIEEHCSAPNDPRKYYTID
ncbi:ATP-binding protein [Oscillospiraceae bacterium 44-34]